MNDRDPFLMIGLHKLAAERGDGFAPELLSLLLERGRRDLLAARPDRLDADLDSAHHHAESAACINGNDNVVPFPGRQKCNPGR
ncbi:hypothetical protein M2360_005103 [Rhizobium sp. SG_E_25_P2]|nr:hypothetical protein [Rhizobium sp. SG_E_25_P2]